MYQKIIDKIKPELDKALDYFKGEVAKLRTSRATPSLVEDIEVDCFGQKMTVKELGSISCLQSNQIVIEPWDKSYIESIEKAISKSDLGLTPNVNGGIIRLKLPFLSEERRDNLVKILSEKTEQARQTIRHWRKEAWDEIQDIFQEGKMGEDEKYKGKDKLQELIDEYNQKIEKIAENKKEEISKK